MKKNAAELALRWLRRDLNHLTDVEQRVLKSTLERTPLSRDPSKKSPKDMPIGARLSDSLALS